ncbi:MAG TPA: AAA family ATPase [Polyangiales bacterium]|nr:AAA family ATPase [Polyangiales bacterium]
MATLEHDLQDQGFSLRETHISRVFLGPERVFKLKKPVQLGFLDFSTLERRRRYCHAELELNRRLAPDVYLDVVPVTRDARGVHHLRGDGEIVDYAVEMLRLSDSAAADARLREGTLGHAELERIAVRLAAFHAAARCDAETEQYGSLDCIERNVRENFEQTREAAPRALQRSELAAIERWQLAFLRERRAVFERRIAQRRIRDGHGDLRLEHCYLGPRGEVQIIDCIEFNERFRYGDVCADMAFLAMDLSWHERRDLSEALIAYYARESGDYELYALLDFYQSYRAYVRGKVSSILEASAGSESVRQRANAQARKYYLLAEACTREALERPRLFAVGGSIASGKSTLAARLGRSSCAPVIASDRLRKQLAGVAPLEPLRDAAFSGNYTPEQSERVYAELLRLAEVVLASGRSVVLDASFRESSARGKLRELAARRGVALRCVECWAPDDVIRARLVERAKAASVSDGRSEVLEAFNARYEPTEADWLRVDTSRGIGEETLNELSRA